MYRKTISLQHKKKYALTLSENISLYLATNAFTIPYAHSHVEKCGHRLNHTCENQYHKTFQLATSGINLLTHHNVHENLYKAVEL